MSRPKLASMGLCVAVCLLAAAGAFYVEYHVFGASPESGNVPPSPTLLTPATSSEQAALVFDEPEVDLGIAKESVSHRFTYQNAGTAPLTITGARPSCSCIVSRPGRTILQPGESGSITLEVDVSRKAPGAHRFLIFLDYECGDRKATATAALRVLHQPDLYVTPSHLEIVATEGSQSTADITVIDYHKQSLKVLNIRPSSPAIKAKITESPGEYLPGWRHVIEVTYTDTSEETRRQFPARILIETSDPETPTLTIDVTVRRLDRLRLAPQSVVLQPGRPVAVVLRDSLGENVTIAGCDSDGLAEASFTKEGEPAKKVSLSLPAGKVNSSKYPATVWVRVSKPCERRLPVTVDLDRLQGPRP